MHTWTALTPTVSLQMYIIFDLSDYRLIQQDQKPYCFLDHCLPDPATVSSGVPFSAQFSSYYMYL